MNDYERKLIKSARKGSVAAYEELIQPHRSRIYNFMLNVSGNEFEASHMAQEVFVKVFQELMSQQSEDSLVFNIYRTAGEISRQEACISKKIS